MTKISTFISLAATAVLAAACGNAGKTAGTGTMISNPVISKSFADPTVWKEGEVFRCVSTGVGTVWESRDFANWTSTGKSPLSQDARSKVRALGRNLWAPDVTEVNGERMMYLTCYKAQTDCRIAVLKQDKESGLYEFVGTLTDSNVTGIKDTIDPEVVTDPKTGKVWLFFGSTGRIHRVELNKEGTQVLPGAEYSLVAGVDVDTNPERDKVFEGAYLHYHKGWWYLFVSAGQYWNETYRILVGRSRSLEGEFLSKDGRKMKDGFAESVISSGPGDNLFGPGHNGEIFTDSRKQDYIIYHCHCRSLSESDRYGCIQRLYWGKDGWPFVENGKPAIKEAVFRSK